MRDYERLIVTTVVHCAYIIVFIYLCIYFYLYIFGVCNTKTLPIFHMENKDKTLDYVYTSYKYFL